VFETSGNIARVETDKALVFEAAMKTAFRTKRLAGMGETKQMSPVLRPSRKADKVPYK
jgi:hypothetical protein